MARKNWFDSLTARLIISKPSIYINDQFTDDMSLKILPITIKT